ncbi:hypothetical protein PV325_010363 [Microctonus aethiopoides]
MDKAKNRFYWKGRLATEKVYNLRLKQKTLGQKLQAKKKREVISNLKEKANKFIKLEGRRVFNPHEFEKQMFCKLCKNLLSILDVTHEEEVGLGSILYISYQNCNFSNKITTDKQRYTPSKKKQFDCNTKALIGTFNSGFGFTQLNKFLAAMNLPTMSWDIFKSVQKEITPVIEKMAYASCSKATEEEKILTISNPEELKKLL